MAEDTWQTSTTLLRRLRETPTDQMAWSRFVDRYGPLIYRWGRRRGLQPADTEELLQNVLLALSRQLQRFIYKPGGNFRGWLHTVCYRVWCQLVAEQTTRLKPEPQIDLERICTPEAGADFLEMLERESERELLELACSRVRDRVQARTWEAFRLMAIEQLSGAEVAARLGMQTGTVFVARSKVQRMLREEITRLNEEADV